MYTKLKFVVNVYTKEALNVYTKLKNWLNCEHKSEMCTQKIMCTQSDFNVYTKLKNELNCVHKSEMCTQK